MNLYVVKKVFVKDGQEIPYYECGVDLGYRKVVITKDKACILALADITDRQLFTLEVDKELVFGKIDYKVGK